MKSLIIIVMAGFLVAGIAAAAWAVWAAWLAWQARKEPPRHFDKVKFRTEIWNSDRHHIIF